MRKQPLFQSMTYAIVAEREAFQMPPAGSHEGSERDLSIDSFFLFIEHDFSASRAKVKLEGAADGGGSGTNPTDVF